eukprot:COSAG06_NODE_13092_length_1294_cov_0.861925_2_plen_132_part_01
MRRVCSGWLGGLYLRRYDKYKVAPAFPFGHGLSYGSFKYSDLKVEGRTISMTVERIADYTHQHRQQQLSAAAAAANSSSDSSSSESLAGGSCDTPQICELQLGRPLARLPAFLVRTTSAASASLPDYCLSLC